MTNDFLRLVGVVLIAIPFVGVTALCAWLEGWGATLAMWLTVVLVVSCLVCGMSLVYR